MIFDSAYFSGSGFVQVYSLGGGPAVVIVVGPSFYFNLMLVTEQAVRCAINTTGQSARSGLLTAINIREDLDV